MSRNGSGSYSLPALNPVVTGTSVSSTWANNTMNDIASALTQSVSNDGQTPITANLPMTGFKHTNVANATARTEYCAAGQAQDNTFDWLTSVAGTDTITATAAIGMSAYAAGQCFRFVAAGANTGTSVTLNLNSLGAKSVTKNGATALAVGDIPSGALIEVVYDGTRFQIVGVALNTLLTNLGSQTVAANKVQAYSGANTPTLLTTGTASGNIPLVGTVSATKTLAGLDTTDLLYEETIAGAAATSFTSITGLDINTHKSYRIEIELINATASPLSLYMYVNGDTTATNYYAQDVYFSAGATTPARVNYPQVIGLAASASGASAVNLHLLNGYPVFTSVSIRNIGATVELENSSVSKTATVANITQLDFTASVASSIGIGSKIRIYRGNA